MTNGSAGPDPLNSAMAGAAAVAGAVALGSSFARDQDLLLLSERLLLATETKKYGKLYEHIITR